MRRVLLSLSVSLMLISVSHAQKVVTVAGGYIGDHKLAPQASFAFPTGLAFDNSGNLYVADSNHCLIRVVGTKGTINTFAGNGLCGYSGDGGRATAARFSTVYALAFDAQGNLLVADAGNSRIRKITASGMVTTVAGNGTFGYSGDGGPATQASLGFARGIAVDAAGNIYIADSNNNVVRLVDTAGIIRTVAGNHSFGYSGDGGPATAAQMQNTNAVAVDGNGDFYIAETSSRIRKVDATGTITTVAGNGQNGNTGDGGPGTSAAIGFPEALVIDKNGALQIATLGSVWTLDLATNVIHLVAGATGREAFTGDGGPALSANLNQVNGMCLDAAGNLLLGDSANDRVREVSAGSQIISTVAGGSLGEGHRALASSLNIDFGGHMAIDNAGNVYVADTFNNLVRKITPKGDITTVAGVGTSGYSGDFGPAIAAQLWWPMAVAVDGSGNLFIMDSQNSAIRKVDTTGTITTLQIHPIGFHFFILGGILPSIAVDSAGNLYISDSLWAVWKIDPSGNAAIVAGTEFAIAYGGDGGPATQAMLNFPTGVAVDAAGNLYIADWLNNRVRKVDTNGIITTIAGTGFQGFSGDGGPATSASLNLPTDVVVDASGNVYIADWINLRIRIVDQSGTILTIAGSGGAYNGNRVPALQAGILPIGLALDSNGQLYFSDSSSYRVRTIQK